VIGSNDPGYTTTDGVDVPVLPDDSFTGRSILCAMFAHESSCVGAWRTLLAVAVGLGFAGCSEPQQAKETGVRNVIEAPPPQAERKPGPFRHPDKDPPADRSGEQLPSEELEAALKEASDQIAKGDKLAAIRALRKCANKLTPSPRCEGEIGIAMWEVGRHRAHARFFVQAAASMDDPKADAAFWRRLGDTAMRMARFEAAADAYQKMVDTGGKSADDYEKLSKALLGRKADVKEAIEALRKGYKADPSRHDLLFDIAVLTAQIPDRARARELLTEYLAKTEGQDPKRDATVKARIEELGRARQK
jgi:tetratricopeptide (TPR) repeat protein